jgi:hypothetical protein
MWAQHITAIIKKKKVQKVINVGEESWVKGTFLHLVGM